MWCSFRQGFSRLLLLGTLAIFMVVGLTIVNAPPARASLRTLQEAPGQFLYQSRHKLQDERGNAWQVVFFKRVTADKLSTVNLRLVAFPGTAEFVHPQPLKITTKTGESFEAADRFAERSRGDNIGQYDMENLLSQLPASASVNLVVNLKDDRQVAIEIPSEIILEWQIVAGYS